MLSQAFIVGALAVAVPAVLASTPYDTFYPPTLNSTDWITNSSIGTYGGIYYASKESTLGQASYGTYDYCAMPHPRVTEYPMPSAVSNGSVTAKLVYLEYIQRHQRRTPYNIFPEGEVGACPLIIFRADGLTILPGRTV